MNHVILDAVDAVELIEILEYFIETLDRTAEHHHTLQRANPSPYGIDDLRADLARLADRLRFSPLTP